MRKAVSVVAVMFALVLTSYALAKDAAAKPLHGKVTAVAKDGANTKITISSHGKAKGDAPVEHVVSANASTKVTKGSDAATLDDVKEGVLVSVTLGADDTATSIDIRPAHGKK